MFNKCLLDESSCWSVPFPDSKCGACPLPGPSTSMDETHSSPTAHGTSEFLWKLLLRVSPWTSPPQVQTPSWRWGCSQQDGPWCFLPRKHSLSDFPCPFMLLALHWCPHFLISWIRKSHLHRFSAHPADWWQHRPAVLATGQDTRPCYATTSGAREGSLSRGHHLDSFQACPCPALYLQSLR